jgi:hypothetical protein
MRTITLYIKCGTSNSRKRGSASDPELKRMASSSRFSDIEQFQLIGCFEPEGDLANKTNGFFSLLSGLGT